MTKLLVVDDEIKIREVISEYASLNGYQVLTASDGEMALKVLEKNEVDLVILDIMMPNLDGFSTCKIIKRDYDLPIIMLSARSEEYDKLYGFDLGIADYVVKPFSLKELMARIKAVLQRSDKKTQEVDFIYKGLRIDEKGHTITVNGEKVDVTLKEFELLIYLLENKGIALKREEILEDVWDLEYTMDYRTVDTHVKMLRKSLGEYRDLIKTVRGVGYKFEI